MGLGNAGENLSLDLLFGGNQSKPTTLYIGLLDGEPTDGDTGSTVSELSGGSYARVAVTNNTTNFGAASGGVKTNATTITFPTATADWGIARWAGIFSAASGGSLYGYGPISPARNVLSGQTPRFTSGTLTVTAD